VRTVMFGEDIDRPGHASCDQPREPPTTI
jgi:hypothetical protein